MPNNPVFEFKKSAMKVYYGFDNLPVIDGAVVTMGSFDGVHRGHRLLLEHVCKVARESGGESVVLTFDPHPREIIHPDLVHRKLSTLREKLFLLSQTQVDHVVVINFTKEFSQTSSVDFVQQYLISKLNTRIMITGQGHFFGKNKSGDVALLREQGVSVMDLERFDNISSTLIRDVLESGDMAQAQELLGSGYLVELPLIDSSKILPLRSAKYLICRAEEPNCQQESVLEDVINSSQSGFMIIKAKV